MFHTLFHHDKAVLSFDIVGNTLYALSGKSVYRIVDGKVNLFKNVFPKDGKSRSLVADQQYVYCRDFYTLYVLAGDTLEVIHTFKLGTDLSSDICGITHDATHIFITIRGGDLVRVSKADFTINRDTISDNSIWVIQPYDDNLYCGSVDGCLYVIDKVTLDVKERLTGHKENCDGLIVCEDIIISTSKDRVIKRNRHTFEVI